MNPIGGQKPKTIIGIDPGSYRMGFAVIESSPIASSRPLKLLYAEVLEAPKTMSLYPRLGMILERLETRLSELPADEVAIEDLFHAANTKSAFHLGLARGVAIAACLRRGLGIHEYAPTRVKSIVTGSGRADKTQVKKMLEMCLGFELKVGLDATDAIAIAFCHAQCSRLPQLLQPAGTAPKKKAPRPRRSPC